MPDVKIQSLDDREFDAYCALPMAGNGPGLIVIQEIFGVNANMRKICDDYAARGYMAVCPDLFWRQERNVQITDKTEAEWAKAFGLYKGFDVEAGVRDLLSTLAFVRKMKGCSGKVGSVGYCLGGRLAFLMSTRSDIDVSVGYYGVELDTYADEIYDIRTPLLLHMAELDKFVPEAARAKIARAAARNPNITTHLYTGVDHAFAREGGQNYNKEAAELANLRTQEFLFNVLMA